MAFEQSDQVWLIIFKRSLWLLYGKQIIGDEGGHRESAVIIQMRTELKGMEAEVPRWDQESA